MTLHAAKGLEFETVFLPGWEEGLFPHQRSLDEEGLSGLEEERRLAYVGITRAKKEAMIFYAANRRIYNQWQNSLPSRFVNELPSENIDTVSGNGLNFGVGRRDENISTGAGFDKLSETVSYGAPKRRGHASDGTIIEAEEWTVSASLSNGKFQLGDRVFHQKFGYGKILFVDGNKLEVEFEKAGTKKVIDSFVDPT
jgi:DNA helicase-2/ATP-dependent DNA helicase PcrA